MLSDILKRWIAQSESWQTFIDFRLPEESIAKYDFLERSADFYVSLFGSLYDLLEDPESQKEKLLSVAKGLEIYSLKSKKGSFQGVNQENNILFAAGCYYLADFASSAFILANLFSFQDYQTDIERFLLSFLNRKELGDNAYRRLLDSFLKTGDSKAFEDLLKKVRDEKDFTFKYAPYLFSVYYLTETILTKFQKNNIWTDLLKVNSDARHWQKYVEKSIYKKYPIWDFFPSQREALNKGILGEYSSMALQTPTSSGKTALTELLIYHELQKKPDCKILYLAPFRALASELKQSFGKNLSSLGISLKAIYGGDMPTAEEERAIRDVSVLISTPEKFVAIQNIEPTFSEKFSMIICDEGHLIDESGGRGLSYELLLSKLKRERKKFVFLSAIIPNIKDINLWLGGGQDNVVESNYRATEIEYAFLQKSESSSFDFNLIVNPLSEFPKKYILFKFLTKEDLSYNEKGKKKVLNKIDDNWKSKSAIIALKALHSGTVALFAPTKFENGVNGLGAEVISQIEKKPNLSEDLNLKIKSEEKEDLKKYFATIFGNEYLLTRIVDYGILLHHGDLPQYVREIIEEYIRQEKIKLVICTNTLAEGVNLPIRTIVVHTTRRDNRVNSNMVNLRDLKNLFGRAGRAGKETKGLIIVPNPKDIPIVEKVIKEKNIQEVKGFLFSIIKSLTDREFNLTPEVLNSLSESDKELIDIIDKTIIDLFEENIFVENLETEIKSLINETFAFYQSNESEKKTLYNLISLRGEKLIPYIKNSEFSIIKKSGINFRNYEEIKDKLDLENKIWLNLEKPDSDEWLDFILNIVFDLSTVKFKFQKFNEINLKKQENYLTMENIKKIIKIWIKGGWFKDISEICFKNVDISLRIIKDFIGYNLQTIFSSLIHIAESRLLNEGKEISKIITDFPQYLLYGLNNRLQLDLTEIGFTDRIGIIELSKIIDKELSYSELLEFKYLLVERRDNLIDQIRLNIPKISLDKMMGVFDALEYEINRGEK